MKKRIITIAGSPGSGKSSTAKQVASKLGYKHFSSGDLFRSVAQERGVTIEEINAVAELEKEIDLRVDELLRHMYAQEKDLVIDSRLAWHWMPNSFKVYLKLDLEHAAQRIYDHIKSSGRVSEHAESVEKVNKNLKQRAKSEDTRFHDLYGIEINEATPFDLIVDTKTHDLETTVRIILNEYKKWLAG